MSEIEVSLCGRVVGELFGPLCARVAIQLLREGEASVALLKKATGLAVEEIRRCLVVLLHHRIIAVNPGKGENFTWIFFELLFHSKFSVVTYSCSGNNVYPLLFYKYYTKGAQLSYSCTKLHMYVLPLHQAA